MLLANTAGLEFLTPFQEKHAVDSLPLYRFITTALMTPLRIQPDTTYHYSNVGFTIAGAIVERVAEMPYEDFLQQRIFEPLGMNDTTFFPNADQIGWQRHIH
jgi:CubicO group peptidase (beta-lactamase class C family)